jgi:arylsulfatase A-like enzyme
MKIPLLAIFSTLFWLQSGFSQTIETKPKSYNVLFIAIDDLNDWVGCLGGHPQAITPNLDKFAKEQAMVMGQAFCPSTVCCPTRSAILTGKRASSTGVYGNDQNLKNAAKAKDLVTLPEHFGKNGYRTLTAGKIFHHHHEASGDDHGEWAFQEVVKPGGANQGMLWEESPNAALGKKDEPNQLEWGASKAPVEKTKDFLACKWAAKELEREPSDKPFFMALGISKPHLPWFVPQQFFDLYPLDTLKPVEIFRNDLDDITNIDGKKVFQPDKNFQDADKANMHLKAQRAYLANVSYVDHCLGVVFEALKKSKYADNTIVMIWGDHGWHLSEKMKYGKIDLWQESAQVPFFVRVPGMTPADFNCKGVVNLLDMYPTLVELCGLPTNSENEGRSFVPLLKNPKMVWNHPSLTTYKMNNHSLTDGRYRYTWYGGRAEELYDHSSDPLEHKNLASLPESKEIIARLKAHLPTHNEPDSPRNGSGNEKKKEKVKK